MLVYQRVNINKHLGMGGNWVKHVRPSIQNDRHNETVGIFQLAVLTKPQVVRAVKGLCLLYPGKYKAMMPRGVGQARTLGHF